MDALAYAVAMAAANAAAATPFGGGDLVHYQGEIVSWDEVSAVNAEKDTGEIESNLTVLQSGIGVTYQPGDTEMIEKRMSQWYILGKVTAPGASAGNQIQSAAIATSQNTTSTSYTDLPSVGPVVTVTIGSSRRCLVMVSATVISLTSAGTPVGQWVGGSAAFDVAGASTIAAGPYYTGAQTWYSNASPVVPVGIQTAAATVALLTAAQGRNQGTNTFTMRYRALTSNPGAGFADRSITVIPF